MRPLLDRLYDFRRRHWGRYSFDDPRPIAREAPYTFHLPSEDEASALRPGDLVKLVFRSDPPGRKWDAERMWVEVAEVSPDSLIGILDNDPSDIPQLKAGARVSFQAHHVIDIDWADPVKGALFAKPEKQVWDRCMVDRCVIEDGVPVSYVYREPPDLGEEGDTFPDSGWRVRGDWRGLTDEEVDAREANYVAIGLVLNKDDSWLHLLHEPIGSAYMRNFETGLYVPEDRPEG